MAVIGEGDLETPVFEVQTWDPTSLRQINY